MSFATPAYLAFLALVPVLVALYFKKSRPIRKVLPSTKLWEEVLRRMSNDSLFQKYRHSIFLALQLLVLCGLVLGLSRPHLKRALSGRTILVLDTSASMRATDVSPSRFARAREAALDLLGRIDTGGDVALVTADREVVVRAPFGTDLARTVSLVRALEPTDHNGPDAAELTTVIESLQQQRADRVVLLTDTLPGDDLAGRLRGLGITLRRFASSGDNMAVTRFEVRARTGAHEAVVQVTSFATAPRTARLDLIQLGKTVATQPVTLPGRGDQVLRFDALTLGEGPVEARLVPAPGTDHLAADDRAWASVGKSAATVLLAGSPHGALARALRTVPGVQLSIVPSDATTLPPADVVVCEGQLELPSRNALLFAPLADATHEAPRPSRSDSTHPLLKYLSFKDVTFTRAAPLPRQPGDVEVLGAADAPLLLARTGAGFRQVLCAFATDGNDFSLRVSFPIFVMNALRWIGGTRLERAPGAKLSFEESNLAPSKEGDLERAPRGASEGSTPVGIARWLLALALAVMVVEWALYARLGG